MAIINHPIKISETKEINCFINTRPPKMTDDEYIARAGKWNEFVRNIGKKYRNDLSNNQLNELGLILTNIVAPFQSCYLNFSPDEVLSIPAKHAEKMLSTLKEFRNVYQEQKNNLEQDL